jgi:hypothetical protein
MSLEFAAYCKNTLQSYLIGMESSAQDHSGTRLMQL